MFDEMLMKFVSVLSVDDIRLIKKMGFESEARHVLDAMSDFGDAWESRGLVSLDTRMFFTSKMEELLDVLKE